MVARSGTLAYIPHSIGVQLTRWVGCLLVGSGSRKESRAKRIATWSSQKRRCAARHCRLLLEVEIKCAWLGPLKTLTVDCPQTKNKRML